MKRLNRALFCKVVVTVWYLGLGGLLAANSVDPVRGFYENPTYERYCECTETIGKLIENASSEAELITAHNMVAFLSMVQQGHPEFFDRQFADAMRSTTTSSHYAMFLAAVCANPEDARIPATLRLNLRGQLTDSHVGTDFKNHPIQHPGDIDLMWGCFEATGEPVYVNSILDYLFSNEQIMDDLKSLSSDELAATLQAAGEAGNLLDYMTVFSGIWSVRSMMDDDLVVKRIVVSYDIDL